MAVKAICPSCGEWVTLKAQPKLGLLVTCNECETELEVVEIDPVELDWAYYNDLDEDEEYEAEDAEDDN